MLIYGCEVESLRCSAANCSTRWRQCNSFKTSPTKNDPPKTEEEEKVTLQRFVFSVVISLQFISHNSRNVVDDIYETLNRINNMNIWSTCCYQLTKRLRAMEMWIHW